MTVPAYQAVNIFNKSITIQNNISAFYVHFMYGTFIKKVLIIQSRLWHVVNMWYIIVIYDLSFTGEPHFYNGATAGKKKHSCSPILRKFSILKC